MSLTKTLITINLCHGSIKEGNRFQAPFIYIEISDRDKFAVGNIPLASPPYRKKVYTGKYLKKEGILCHPLFPFSG
jgi:hypothetical protein